MLQRCIGATLPLPLSVSYHITALTYSLLKYRLPTTVTLLLSAQVSFASSGKMSTATPAKTPAWHESLPAPKNKNPGSITRQELLLLLQAQAVQESERQGPGEEKQKFVLVDVRRTDYEGGTIHGSINLPAQSLYHTIPRLYDLFTAAGVQTVIWYCGSSRGRGTRAAGWFSDHIASRSCENSMSSIILLDGITGWAHAGEEYVTMMDDYSAEAWKPKGGEGH